MNRSFVPRHVMFALALTLGPGCGRDGFRNLKHAGSLAVEPAIAQVPQTELTEIRDGNGTLVGTESRVIGYQPMVVGFRLTADGKDVDERDFYQLAGDGAAAARIGERRDVGRDMQRAGLGLILAGTAAAIALPILAGVKVAPYAVGQWFLSVPIGLGLFMYGRNRIETYAFDGDAAFAALGQPRAEWLPER